MTYERVPTAAAIDFSKVGQLGNALLTQLDALRAAAPIAYSPVQRAWIVTGHAEVLQGFRGDLPLSVAGRLLRVFDVVPADARDRIPHLVNAFSKMLVSLDPPEQTRLRKLMVRAFSKKVAESYRPYARDLCNGVLERAAAKRHVEVVEEIARPIAGGLIVNLMGLPEAYADRLQRWAADVVSGLAGGGVTPALVYQAEAAIAEMGRAFLAEIAKRRASASDDFISMLITADEGGERLTDDEIVATCVLILIAGHDTTTNSMTLGTAALAGHREAREYIRTHPDEIGSIVMELNRYIAMSTGQVRVVTEDFEWGGQRLKAGQLVYLMIAAANRDPAVFSDPERLDFSRPQDRNATFGPGLHHCIGHLLAKMQLAEFFSALVERFEDIVLEETPDSWGTALSFRGLRHLRVRLVPRTPAGPNCGTAAAN
jgi:cytochrome P450